jgi:hypothetical protein
MESWFVKGHGMIAAIRRFFDPLKHTVEALQWLRDNRNNAALAGNRFHSTQEAIEFVQCLYDAGAEAVAIPIKRIFSEAWRIEQEGGPYTETLLVKLPKELEKRRAVWRICEREYQREYGEEWEQSPEDFIPSSGIVDLWWD